MKKVVLLIVLCASLAGADTRLGWSDLSAETSVNAPYWYACRYDIRAYGFIASTMVYFTRPGLYSVAVFGYDWPHKLYFRELSIPAEVGWNYRTIDLPYTEQRYALVAVWPQTNLGLDKDYPHHLTEMYQSPTTGTIRFTQRTRSEDLMIHVWVRNTSGVHSTSLGRIKALY